MNSAGARTELVTFRRETPTRRDGGGASVSVTDLGQAWASVTWARGGEEDRQGAVREIAIYKFRVLSAAAEALGITSSDRIVWNGETYNIRERPRRLITSPETEIVAETGVTL